jgi:hypothetical protein
MTAHKRRRRQFSLSVAILTAIAVALTFLHTTHTLPLA